MFRIKICGIRSTDVLPVLDGPDAVGFNFHPPSPRFVDVATAREVRAKLPTGVLAIGVFVDQSASEVEAIAKAVGLDAVQLHGSEKAEEFRALTTPVIRAIRIRSAADLNVVDSWDFAAAVLLDGSGAGGAFGGATFDWSLFAEARRRTTKPVLLGGGLTIENVARGIREARPDGVDVASGVEKAPGVKDRAKVEAFLLAARRAFAEPR